MRVAGFIVMRASRWEDAASTPIAVVTSREDAIRILDEELEDFDLDCAASITARYHVMSVS